MGFKLINHQRPHLNVYEKDGEWTLLSGENWGDFFGYTLVNGTWTYDSSVVYGLSGPWRSAPTVFYDDGWKAVVGEMNGNFLDRKLIELIPPSNLQTEHQINGT